MGEEFAMGETFFIGEGGDYIPFSGITEVKIDSEKSPERNYDVPYEYFGKDSCMEARIDITKRTAKNIRKQIRKMDNWMMRRVRYVKRLKEYARRRKLKGARWQ